MLTRMLNRNRLFSAALALLLGASIVQAQTTAFTYQGKLTDNGNPATGNYDFQVKLFDTQAVGTGTQQGTTLTVSNITVTGGVFTLPLDFGACAGCFNGANRFLEIAVKMTSGGTFTTLGPRQPLTSTPYAIRSLISTAADGLSVACVSCITSSQIQSVNGSAVTGTIPVASFPAGSANYIQNTTSPQATANFNISGDGTAGGTLAGNVVESATQFNLAGNRILSNPGTSNLFVGVAAGAANSTGLDNAFFGAFAGQANLAGSANSFFGVSAGYNNTGSGNAFFGRSAGFQNTAGTDNSFFGTQAGRDNSTGSGNSFFGRAAGIGTTTSGNSFFGAYAGSAVNTAINNSFFGAFAGNSNTTGNSNVFFGYAAGYFNTMGNSNSFFGSFAGSQNTEGNDNSFFGYEAGNSNTTGFSNAFFGTNAGVSNTTGEGNAFFGYEAGRSNTTFEANSNSFFGSEAGTNNTTGFGNAFFGRGAGLSNTTGISNTAIGLQADVGSSNLDHATAIGAGALVTASNRVQIGRIGLDTVAIGAFAPASPPTQVCVNNDGVFINCSSSLRYKTDVRPFYAGLSLIQRLRPISFTWKEGGLHDIGLGAEEVAEVDEQFTFRNPQGQIEGVKYGQLSILFINAIKEQQTQVEKIQKQIGERQPQAASQQRQIEQDQKQLAVQQARITELGVQLAKQQSDIDALKQLLCPGHPQAEVCQATRRKK